MKPFYKSIKTQQLFDAVPPDILQIAIDDYHSKEKYDTNTMNKASPGKVLPLFTPLIEHIVGKKLIFKSGNYYKHQISFLPHTDFKESQGNTLNVVIPLSYTGKQTGLVIFDQIWNQDSVTWCLTNPLLKFDVNAGVIGNPCDYPDVMDLTGKEINLNLWEKWLSHYPKECYFGLSGQFYPFQPGSIILFDNRHIHCTGTMEGEKLGLTLRYEL